MRVTAPTVPAPAGRPARVRRPGPPRRPGGGRLITVLAVLLAGAGSAAAGWGSPPPAALLLLPLLAGAEVTSAALLPGRARWGDLATEACVAAALALAAGAWITAATVTAAVLAQAIRHRPRARARAAALRLAAASGAAVAVSVAVGGLPGAVPVTAAAAGMTAWWAVAHSLAVAAVARTTGRKLRRLLSTRAPQSFTTTAAGSALGITTGWLAVHAPAGLLGLLAPLALLITATRQAAWQATEASLFAELARGGGGAPASSVDDSAQLLVTSAARLLGGADVELVVLGAEGAVRYAGTEAGPAVRAVVDPDAFDEPWLLGALGSGARGARSGVEAGRPVLTVVLDGAVAAAAARGGAVPVAVLVARRPRGAVGFSRRDAHIVEALAAQASGWLAHAAVPGRQPALPAEESTRDDARPALGVLRDAAARLVRLAGTREAVAGGTAAIVEELQVVERSVAALIGVTALHPGTPQAALEPDLQWTSTGVLE